MSDKTGLETGLDTSEYEKARNDAKQGPIGQLPLVPVPPMIPSMGFDNNQQVQDALEMAKGLRDLDVVNKGQVTIGEKTKYWMWIALTALSALGVVGMFTLKGC